MPKYQGLWWDLHRLNVENPDEFIKKLYLSGMSGGELSNYLLQNYGVKTTPKTLEDWANKGGYVRTKSEAKMNAINRGRMIYKKKPEHEKYKTKSVHASIRMQVLKRDNFQCSLCGNSPKTGYSLEIHHKNPDSNELDNLTTLCFQCHRGLHANK